MILTMHVCVCVYICVGENGQDFGYLGQSPDLFCIIAHSVTGHCITNQWKISTRLTSKIYHA